MKKTIYKILTATVMLTMTGCSDFLELEPLNEIVLENFWNEKSDVENVVTGIYASMQSSDCISRMMAWGEFRSDNIIGGTNVDGDADLTNIFKENINASNRFTEWVSFYNIINTCNTVLYYAPQVAEKDPSFTQTDLQTTRAEVIALRDLCYFYLIRAFRDVPFYTEPYLDNTQDFALSATPFAKVLQTLIDDLEGVKAYAVKTYPVNKKGYQTAFITQDAINAMLCDMYLWQQNYTKAVECADKVISSLTTSYQKTLDKMSGSITTANQMIDGYPLIIDKMTSSYYGNAYQEIFGDGGTRETIFELTYSEDETMLSNNAVSTYYGNSTTFPGIIKPAEFISNDMTLDEPTVYMDKYDARYYECLQKTGNDYGINKYVSPSVMILPGATSTITTYGTRCSANLCSSNWIIYRLTDVMLMKAEALVQLADEYASRDDANLMEAYNIVNVVHKRSSMQTVYEDINYDNWCSKSQMSNLVLNERQRELMFEGKRWFDLVRRALRDGNTNYLLSQVTRKGSDNASTVNSKLSREDALFWPYSKDELQVNPNLTQNPAYNTGDENTGYKTTE